METSGKKGGKEDKRHRGESEMGGTKGLKGGGLNPKQRRVFVSQHARCCRKLDGGDEL